MTYDPNAAGAVQLIDSLLAALNVGVCATAGYAYLAAALLFLSVCLIVMGAWNLATR
jgi:hypothetical protein